MRVTMQTLYRNILTNLNRNNVDMNRINGQISSGKQMSRISDNPVNLVNALGLRTNLSEIGQFQKNLQYGTTVINGAENALTQMKDLVGRAKTLAIQQANAPMTPENRANAAKEVKHLWEQAIILANSSVNGKYIFGGFRTAGYSKIEPAPFVQGARDGYFVNGTNPEPAGITGPLTGSGVDNSQNLIPGDLLINGHDVVTLHNQPTQLTGKVDNNAIAAGDLAINGAATAVINAGAVTNGLNMEMAWNAKNEIETADPTVSVTLTTLVADLPVNADTLDGSDTSFNFDLNGANITLTIPDGTNQAGVAAAIVDAINQVTAQTGVEAEIGDGLLNGGNLNSVVFRNALPGDDSPIEVVVNDAGSPGDATLGFADFNQGADATHNTGEITLSSNANFTLTSPNDGDDTILNHLGLGGGTATTGQPDDINDDGIINISATGINLAQDPTHGLNMASATALAAAINDPAVNDLTGVSARLTTLISSTPATGAADNPGGAGFISFELNGETIAVAVAAGELGDDINDRLTAAINAKSELTGVVVVDGDGNNGGANGTLVLQNATAGDDSDIAINGFINTAAGTNLTLANGSHPASAGNTGKISLVSANSFTISTSAALNDPPSDDILDLIGLGGGDLGFADLDDDGILRYGSAIQSGDLLINGKPVTTKPDLDDDGNPRSTIYADASAQAKADAINNGNYNVRAEITPALVQAKASVHSGHDGASRTVELHPDTTVIEGTTYTIKIGERSFAYTATDFDAAVGIGAISAGLAATINSESGIFAYTENDDLIIASGAGTKEISLSTQSPAITAQAVIDPATDDDNDPRDIDLTGTGVAVGATYTITIDGNDFNYVAQLGDDLDAIAGALSTAIDGHAGYSAAVTGSEIEITTGAGSLEISFGVDNTITSLDQAEITPPDQTSLGPDDLKINGFSIFTDPTAITANDADNTLVRAINAMSTDTGVLASRSAGGQLVLTATDGRNIHLETSAKGEYATRLTGATQSPDSNLAAPANQVYFGSVRLLADQPFRLESALLPENGDPSSNLEVGLLALGLTGGTDVTKEPSDLEGDGIIQVQFIHGDQDQVRYAGDRKNDINIKVGQQSTIEVGKNGYDAIYETGVFQILKELEDFLEGDKITSATSAAKAYDLYQTLDSEATGLELADRIGAGTFMVTIANHDSSPPSKWSYTIGVDPEHDTLEDITQRLNAIPGFQATWNDTTTNTAAPKQLQLAADPPGRYSFELGKDTSGLLDAMGLRSDQVQASALQKSIADLDQLQDGLTNQISDFGARANRIEIQNNIYMNLKITTAENLSELEDTDLIQAVMELQSKEIAYQASLNAAAKTMQLSLVDFL